MEFKEVEYIIKEVIVKVEDKIFLKELIGHMHSWDFTIKTVQGIRAEMNNYGEACAVLNFLDAVKKRPVSFPKMIAALKHTQQMDVYDIFIKQVRRYFNKNEVRLAEVLSMISKEEEDLGIKEVHDDTGAVGSFLVSSSGGYRRSNNRSGNRYSQDIYRRGYSWDSTLSSDKPRKAQLSTSLDDKLPGATGKADHNSQNLFQPHQALDPNFAGARISRLKANVYTKLGKALERTNTHGNDMEPWWNYVLIHSDLNVDRNEQRKIGKQRSPGMEVLDILDERGYTLADLQRLFTQFRINEALDILQQHGDKVIDERTSNWENKNNMNVNQRSKTDATKEIDLSFLHVNTSEGQNDKISAVQVLQKQSRRQNENKESSCSNLEINRNPGPMSLSRPDSSNSDLMPVESNTDISSIIEDDSIKGTTAVQAHGDQSNTKSQLNPEDDAMKLRNDRVHQFDLDQGAIENTSFIPVGRTDGTKSNSQTNETEQNDSNIHCDQGGRMSNNEQSVVYVNNLEEPIEPCLSQDNLPLLSGLQATEHDICKEGHVQGQNIESGVMNIPPRSLDSDDKEFTKKTGVNIVPPSIESQSSRGNTEDSCQSEDDENNQTTGSLREPDLIQGTHCGTGPCENVSADENPEN